MEITGINRIRLRIILKIINKVNIEVDRRHNIGANRTNRNYN